MKRLFYIYILFCSPFLLFPHWGICQNLRNKDRGHSSVDSCNVFELFSKKEVRLLGTGSKKIIDVWLEGKKIAVTIQPLQNVKEIEIRFQSSKNRNVSTFTDVSKNTPNFSVSRHPNKGKDIWFPVVDIELGDGIKAVAEFDNVRPGMRYCLNGNFWPGSSELKSQLVFGSKLEHWENAIFIEGGEVHLRNFYLRKRITFSKSNMPIEYIMRSLSEDWTGIISVFEIKAHKPSVKLGEIAIEYQDEITAESNISQINRKNLINSIRLTIDYLLRSVNANPKSPTYGGQYMFYDIDKSMYRRSDWIWSWGPSIKFLIDACKVPEIASIYGREKLLKVARAIGEASLRFQILDTDHPAYGLIITRFDPRLYYQDGHTGYSSPADAFFMAGWGWIPLYEATGDKCFLDATRLMLDQYQRIMKLDSQVEQDYILKIDKWKDWTMDESAFGMEGFAELFRVTGDKKYKEEGLGYIENLTSFLEMKNGLWSRRYSRNDPNHDNDHWPVKAPLGTSVKDKQSGHTRGVSWVIIGMEAAYRLSHDCSYLEKAKKMADYIIDSQYPNGALPYRLDINIDKQDGVISEKGTAIWSLLLYRLYDYTKNEKYLEAARRCLSWCMGNQYCGNDINAKGGIIGISPASGIVYREYYPMICTYTMSFFGNALLSEINLHD